MAIDVIRSLFSIFERRGAGQGGPQAGHIPPAFAFISGWEYGIPHFTIYERAARREDPVVPPEAGAGAGGPGTPLTAYRPLEGDSPAGGDLSFMGRYRPLGVHVA